MAHHSFHHHTPVHNPFDHPKYLDVISVVSNTQRYESRYRLFKNFQEHMKEQPHVRFHVVEMAFGERPTQIIHPTHGTTIRSEHELWHKENMLNIGLSRLPEDWKYVAWIDADISFIQKNWATEIIEALQHYMVIQPWQHCIDLGPNQETTKVDTSFCSGHVRGMALAPQRKGVPYGAYFHTGYAWAARREAIDALGGFIDTAILGAGDHHMAWSLIGQGEKTIHHGVHESYAKKILEWQDRAVKYIKQDIGHLPGTIYHHFHGKKKDRKYADRWKILIEHQFNPDTDLMKDSQGLWQLRTDDMRQINLRDSIRRYMSSRNEDSIDLD